MKMILLAVGALLGVTGCVGDDESLEEGRTDEPGIELQADDGALDCRADKLNLPSWDAAESCAKPNPQLFDAALQSVVEAGQECTVGDDKFGTCDSIQPVEDEKDLAARIGLLGLDCRRVEQCIDLGDHGRLCTQQYECCTTGREPACAVSWIDSVR